MQSSCTFRAEGDFQHLNPKRESTNLNANKWFRADSFFHLGKCYVGVDDAVDKVGERPATTCGVVWEAKCI